MSKYNFITKTESNYKKTAFRLFIAYVATNWSKLIFTGNGYEKLIDPSSFATIVETISLISTVILVVGVFVTVLSYKNQEQKNFQYKVAFWGFGITLFFMIFPLLMGNDFFD